MDLTPEKKMQHACQHWLEARERLRDRRNTGELHAYQEAGHRLFAAFVSDWTGDDPKLLSDAYCGFQQALAEGGIRRFSTPPLTERTPRSKFWA